MTQNNYVIGVDYGTDSVRSTILDAATGREIASAVHYYTRWQKGHYCDAAQNRFRQHPLDYIEGLKASVTQALSRAPQGTAAQVSGISVDTTGSTPVAVDKAGTPLSLLDEFSENPNAMFVLWKDHTAIEEAARINEVAHSWGGEDFTKYVGGIYSSEWFWAKILHVVRNDTAVREHAYSWVEHCDWIPALLTGTTDPLQMKRSRCAAGHKAMWHESFDGLPSEEFLQAVDPLLSGLRKRLYRDTVTSDVSAGTLNDEWAQTLGLHTGVIVGVGAFDAHMGAVGGEIKPFALSKVMGTSTCDMLIAPSDQMGDKLIRGICGQVDGSIIPGMLGMEAGQSAFGDVYAWFTRLLLWPYEELVTDENNNDDTEALRRVHDMLRNALLPRLSTAARQVPPGESGIIALDWLNGRRTPDANQQLRAAIAGLSLGSDAPRIFRALVEATAFGTRKIIERFRDEGVTIERVIALGGVAKKSEFVMQTVADVIDMPIQVAHAEQTCALGAGMYAATAAGIYDSVTQAQRHMGQGFDREYTPNPDNTAIYNDLYSRYEALGGFVEHTLTGE
jgi:L-ribulokinase